jgi:hypothetical protein
MRLSAPNMSNPFAKQNPLSKPLYDTRPVSAGGVTVETKKPVLVEPIRGELKPLPHIERGFWASKTKREKVIIIAGGIAVLSLVAYFALKKK